MNLRSMRGEREMRELKVNGRQLGNEEITL